MHSFIRRTGAAWAAAGVLLFAWSGIAWGSGAGERHQYKEDLKDYAVTAHFWHVVAGDQNPRPGVLDRLARDLHDLPGGDAVLAFRGDSNRYGGITGELGYDPFDGENCSECGPLDADVADKVLALKLGKTVDEVIGARPAEPSGSSGPPFFIWIGWLISLPLLGLYDRRRQEGKYKSMPHEARILRELDEAQGKLVAGSAQWTEIEVLRQNLKKAVERRIDYGEDEKNTLRIEELKQEASDSLAAITDGNRYLDN